MKMDTNMGVNSKVGQVTAAPRIYPDRRQENSLRVDTGNLSAYVAHDKVEISDVGRQLGAGVIQQMAAKYYGTAEINESLERVLNGKEQKVSDAVYNIIQSNLMMDGSVESDEDRGVLIEIGLTQAKFIADHYMGKNEAELFMITMNKIAAIAKTRTVDPVTGQASYITPEQRPGGAPDDYVKVSEIMRRFDPETYQKFIDEIADGDNGLSELVKFAKKLPNHPEWIKDSQEKAAQVLEYLQNLKLNNQFGKVDISSMKSFQESMRSKFGDMMTGNVALYNENMQYFAHMLGD